ncbi:hypothetical protein [Paludisphaera rhizosphaerae]|uniref:hypothetical protein n=1 Tax=Paludisphaera rhizosphaerae TaxID=2711216 RepID=UPI0013EAB625|nr:hypothetical protein [Paludisphaera rhizosphaerae]
MRNSFSPPRIVWLAALLLAAGCSETGPPPAGYVADSLGPHDGLLVPLPKDKGFGEILSRPLPKATAKADATMVVYFLGPDKATPLSPPPSDASLRLKLPGQDAPADVPLKLQADAKDPSGAALFASTPGLYAMDQLFGDLTVTVDGESATIPFEKHR